MKDLSHGITSEDYWQGNLDAGVQIVMYVDVSDPEFSTLHQQAMTIRDTFEEQIVLVYRYFPNTEKNPLGYAVAQALASAGKQGQFWAMVAQLATHPQQLSDGALRQHANAIGLDKTQFEDDFSHPTTLKRIQRDMESAKASGVASAPAIFINGVRQQRLSQSYIKRLIQSK
ncbi:MAG: thioredoxin domain-containing protein [Chloroflexota bacterium]